MVFLNRKRQPRRDRLSRGSQLNRNRARSLFVEPLEDRRLLATLVVTTTADSLATDGACSLREAVINSNADFTLSPDCVAIGAYGADTIDVTTPGTYALSIPGPLEDGALTGDLDLTDFLGGVTILGGGPGSTIIDATGIDRVFDIDLLVPATFSSLTITGGVAADDTFLPGFAGQGGGIYSDGGTLTLTNVELTGNTALGAPGFDGEGGGIFDSFGALSITASSISANTAIGGADLFAGVGRGGGIFAFLTTGSMSDSTISDNVAAGGASSLLPGDAFGGGVFSDSATWFPVEKTTISGNVAIGGSADLGSFSGGGLARGGGVFAAIGDSWSVENSTVSGNAATGGAGDGGSPDGLAEGGGMYVDVLASVSLSYVTVAFNDASGSTGEAGGIYTDPTIFGVVPASTIVAKNTASTLNPDVFGDFLSLDYNLVGDGTGSTGFIGASDQVGTGITPIDPLLGPLQNNNGATETHALLSGSPAIDAADPLIFPPFDQTGATRPTDGDGDSLAVPDVGAFEVDFAIDVQKKTNGVEVSGPADPLMPQIAPGAPVAFTYAVSNLGNVPLSNVVVEDDDGAPFNPPPVLSGGFNVGDTNMDNKLDLTEVWQYAFNTTALDLNVVLDFDTDGLGGTISPGDIIDTEYANFGLTISGDEDPVTGMNRAMAFDSANTTVDLDLGTPNTDFGGIGVGAGGAAGAPGENRNPQGNILIVSDDLDMASPNAANRGTLTFDWGTDVVRINSVDLLDAENGINSIDLFDSGGGLIASFATTDVGNNGYQVVVMNTPFVSKMEISFGLFPGAADKTGVANVDFDLTFTNLVTATGDFNPTGTATDPSAYRNPLSAEINIEKSTQGDDADLPTGPVLLTGATANFEYEVIATGDVPLVPSSGNRSMFVVDDNGTPGTGDDFNATYISGDLDGNGVLELNETWIYQASRVVTPGQFTNVGSVAAASGLLMATASDPSNHFGADPDISIVKTTNGGDGLEILTGSPITWTYVVTNTGNVALDTTAGDIISVTDSQGVTPIFDAGSDVGSDGVLSVGESWTYTAAGTALTGAYSNVGTVNITYTDDDNNSRMVSANDASSYFGAEPNIAIVKTTNGGDGLEILAGSPITWTFVVTNTGNVALDTNTGDVVIVTDDQEFPVFVPASDVGNDGVLSVGESWTYTATGTAVVGPYSNIGTVIIVYFDDNGGSRQVSANDGSSYFGADPDIDVEKLVSIDGGTTFVDADTITGPTLLNGFDAPQFKFIVTNTGNVDLANVTLDDDVLDLNGAAAGTAISIGSLTVGTDFQITITAAWAADQQTNMATAVGDFTDDNNNIEVVNDADHANYFGAATGIDIEKATNGVDADTPTGPFLAVGSTATFTYVVTNTGNVPLSNIVVSDDQGVIVTFVSGDTNTNNMLDLTETWTYTGSTTVTLGQYMNTGTASGDFSDSDGNVGVASDNDKSHHFGADPEVAIEKLTNGVDADVPAGAPQIAPGETVTWTYQVSNPGNIPLASVVVTDDNGTPGDPGDDFNPAPVLSGGFNAGDINMDGLLDPAEVWLYTASAPAQDLSVVLDFETDGDGNALSAGTIIDNEYASYGLTISTDTTYGAMIFDSFYPTGGDHDLGAPNTTFGGPGIGVGGEMGMPGANSQRLDNILIISEDGDQSDPDDNAAGGTITFEWEVPVHVDQVSLLDIDSDEPGGTIVTFDDAGGIIDTYLLQNLSNNSFQSIEIDDELVARMEVNLPSSGAVTEVLFDRIFENIGSVTADGEEDSDPSHYRNPPSNASIGDFVWQDLNEDGIQDNGEPGLAGVGVTLDGAGVDDVFGSGDDILEMTFTDANGNYLFENLPAGDYKVTFDEPAGFALTLQNAGTDDALDSDADPTTGMTGVISLAAGQANDTIDAGLVQTVQKTPRFINFEEDVAGNHLSAGDIIQDQWAPWGLHITTSDPINNPAMLFNTADPTGGDWDLETPGSGVNNTLARGLVLIISEDDDQYDPDDNAGGGQLIFDFDQEVIVERVGILDIESDEADGTIKTFDASGTLLSSTPLQGLGDNSFQELVVGQQGVRRMVVTFTGSSALTHIDYQQCVHPNQGAILQDAGGLVSIDAADYDENIGRNRYQWRQLEIAGDTGAGAMITANNGVNNNTNYAANSPELQYRVNFTQTGTHYIWVRGIGATGSDDSIHVGLNGQQISTSDRISGFNPNWAWSDWTMDGPRATFNVTQTGVQTVNVWMREDGFQYDKLIITTDPNYVPTGDGAAVSARQAISTVVLEAEAYTTLDSPWQEFTDSATGRVYLEAPNGTATNYNNPPADQEVVYDFTVSADGEYQILGLVEGANSSDNSFWVKVDNGAWVLWDVDVTGTGFNWQTVYDRNGPPQALFNLASGAHQLHIKVREDGTKIDRIVVTNDVKLDPQSLYTTVHIEAENFTTAQSPWTVQGACVVAPNGSGSNYGGPPAGQEITYDFSLARGGAFYIQGLVNGPDTGSDSFWVAVDDGDWILWDTANQTPGFEWDYVSQRGGADQVLFNLAAGSHTLRLKVREDGTRLDKFRITEDPGL